MNPGDHAALSSADGHEAGYAIVVDGVSKRHGKRTVVENLSFTVPPGRVTGFLGPDGSGKSTAMKIMLGLAAAREGEATIGGRRYRDLPDAARTVGAMSEAAAISALLAWALIPAGAGLISVLRRDVA